MARFLRRMIFAVAWSVRPEQDAPRSRLQRLGRQKVPYAQIVLTQGWRMAEDEHNGDDDDLGTGVITKTRPKTKRPSLYKVLLLNDDYTPMEFVIHVLERFFNKDREDATRIMLHVHQHGVGVCGLYTYEVAETKVTQVMDFARQHQHPLQCTMEKE